MGDFGWTDNTIMGIKSGIKTIPKRCGGGWYIVDKKNGRPSSYGTRHRIWEIFSTRRNITAIL
jgi:hypothetical protein